MIEYVKQVFTQNGAVNGVVTVSSTDKFARGATVFLSSSTQSIVELQIFEVISSTKVSVKIANGLTYDLFDCSAYTTADNAAITQPADANKQDESANATQAVSISYVPLPDGASTSALQTTGNSSLSSLDGKIPSIGQKLMSASSPVVIASDQTLGVEITSRNNIDAFQRLRVANPTTVFDSKVLNDANPIFWDDQQTTGGGTASVFNTNQASVTMSVSNLTPGTRIRQTYRRFQYQPGKSQFVVMTGVIGAPTSGITRCIGLCDDSNGLFFRSGSTEVEVAVRTNTSGTPVESSVPQSSWNLDKMDGTGISGITIDWSKTQIFVIMFQWLGVGSVWYGLDVQGTLYWVHRIDNANRIGVVYMSNPNLPLRYSISNSGTGPAASITQICSAVISEGGIHVRGVTRSVVRDTSFVTLNNSNWYPIMAFRYKTGQENVAIDIKKINIVCTSNSAFAWYLVVNPTIVGTALTFSNITNSALQSSVTSTNASTVTPGTGIIWDSGVVQQASEGSIITLGVDDFKLGSSINGTSDIIVLAVQRLTGAAETFYSSFSWFEQG